MAKITHFLVSLASYSRQPLFFFASVFSGFLVFLMHFHSRMDEMCGIGFRSKEAKLFTQGR